MAKKKVSKKEVHPSESIIIQAGVVFIIVAAIAIFSYAFANYSAATAVGVGY